jgi:hypothetical protein
VQKAGNLTVKGFRMTLRAMTWAVLVLLTVATSTLRAGDFSPLLPADAHFLATAPEMKPLATAWAGTSLGKLLQGPDMKPFRAALDADNVASLIRLRPWFGWDWSELADVPGQVTFGIFPSVIPGAVTASAPIKAGGKAAPTVTMQAEFVCLIAKGKDEKPAVACRTAGEAYFKKLGATTSTRQVGKVACTSYSFKPKVGTAYTTVFFTTDQYIGAATSFRGAELVLAKLNAPAAAAAPATPAKGLASFAIEPLSLSKLLSKPPAKGKKNMVKFFERQGGADIKLIQGTLELPTQGPLELVIDAEWSGKFPISKGLGILNYLAGPPVKLDDLFGKQAHTVRHWRWDFTAAMKSLGNLFDEWSEPGPSGEGVFDDLLDGLRDDPEGPKVDLRKDLFAQLGPSFTELLSDGAPAKVPPVQHKLVIVDCIDETKVRTTLEKFWKKDIDNKKVKADDNNGILIWHVEPGKSLFVEGQKNKKKNNNQQAASFEAAAVHKKVLYLSENYEALQNFFANQDKPGDPKIKARHDAVYQAGLAVAGKNVGFVGIALSDQSWRVPYLRLQEPAIESEPMKVALLRRALFGSPEALPAGIEKTLPNWAKVQPLAAPTFNIFTPEGEGLHWHYGIVK